MKQWRHPLVLLAVMAPMACSGAARGPRVGAPLPPEAPRPELLRTASQGIWNGHLATARQALATLSDRAEGRADVELDYWSELLALLDCREMATAPRSTGGPLHDPWLQLRRLVQLERTRLHRDGAHGAENRGDGAREVGDMEVAWPPSPEKWSDERPVAARYGAGCPAEAAVRSGGTPSAAEVAAVMEAARSLWVGHPARTVLLLDAAVMEIERGRTLSAGEPLRLLEEVPAGLDALTPAERTQLAVAAALYAEVDPTATPVQMVARLQAALAAQEVSPQARRGLRLRLSERLRSIGRTEDATAVLGPPPHGDDAVGRYMAFRQAEAHARAGRKADVLAEARAALARHGQPTVERDRALSALMDIALRTLLSSSVSAETMEVLEAIGPPRERLARAEAFARLALTSGMFDSAAHVFTWLSENDRDPNRQLQHLARAAVAAARGADRKQFAATFRLLAGQEDLPPPATTIKRSPADDRAERRRAMAGRPGELIASAEADRARGERRKTRSVNWQRALLVVARDALPSLVDNDDQANLAILVDVLQRHLDAGGRGPVDNELTTLYRAASAHLKTGARAYAENIGVSRRPILLGDIILGRTYEVSTPKVEIQPAEPRPLIFVPRKPDDPSAIVRWPGTPGAVWKGSPS